MAAKRTKLIKAADRKAAARPATNQANGIPADGGSEDPASPGLAYTSMIDKWRLINTVLAGTDAMREARTEYLPKHSNEEDFAYNERVGISFLYNVLRLTRDSLVGKVFVEPMTVVFNNEDPQNPPEPWKTILDDIDLRGTDAHSFCRQWFSDAMDEGFAGVFVDMPSMTEEERAQRSAADDLKDKRRPFATIIKGSRLVGATYDVEAGVQILNQLRVLENAIVKDGYAEDLKDRVRVINRLPEIKKCEFVLYQKETLKNSGKEIWVEKNRGLYDTDIIPFWLYYTNEDGVLCSTPPLLDLAHLNVTHWQSTSDQRVILTVARFPMLAVSGGVGENNGKISVGPRQVLHTRDPNGRFYYVEHAGKAIEAGEKDIDALEKRMASYGAEFLRKRVSNVTATERVLDTTESMSSLKDMGLRFKNAVGGMFGLFAYWMDKKFEGTVNLNLDFTQDDSNANDLQHLIQMRLNNDLPLEDYVRALIRFDVLDENTDVDAFCARVRSERADADARDLKLHATKMADEWKQRAIAGVEIAKARPKTTPAAGGMA